MNHLMKYYRLTKQITAFILMSTLLLACSKEDDKVQNEYLIDADLITSMSGAQVLTIASFIPGIYDVLATKQLMDVEVYQITYRTRDVDQNKITASGALLVPRSPREPLPVLSYQHGTLTNLSHAPSLYHTSLETRGLATIFSSAGYIVSVPDYIGYGASQELEHPYEHAASLASASYDMLMAAKEFLHDKDIATSEKLFLTGYSEGGGATMALHQYIEQNSDLQVTLSAPAAGAYNKTAFARDVLQRDENLTFLPNFLWVIHSYNKFYNLNRSWSAYVNEPYASTLSAVSNPFRYGSASVTLNPQQLFTAELKTAVLDGTDTAFVNALAHNDIFDWKPEAPVRIYYGTADDYVFPLNAETAYEAMKARGANVTLIAYEGLDHSSAVMPYILDVLEVFELMK